MIPDYKFMYAIALDNSNGELTKGKLYRVCTRDGIIYYTICDGGIEGVYGNDTFKIVGTDYETVKVLYEKE